MRSGWLDVQVIYNVFDQRRKPNCSRRRRSMAWASSCASPSTKVRLPKWNADTRFEPDDFRNNYFAGDRLARTVRRVEEVRAAIGDAEPDMPTAALKFALKPAAVSTVIPGMRNVRQVEANCSVSDQPPISDALETKLRPFNWRRAFWYDGK
jgi:aryl-alcohol dehydrogenase-like predicted oxidoreductase